MSEQKPKPKQQRWIKSFFKKATAKEAEPEPDVVSSFNMTSSTTDQAKAEANETKPEPFDYQVCRSIAHDSDSTEVRLVVCLSIHKRTIDRSIDSFVIAFISFRHSQSSVSIFSLFLLQSFYSQKMKKRKNNNESNQPRGKRPLSRTFATSSSTATSPPVVTVDKNDRATSASVLTTNDMDLSLGTNHLEGSPLQSHSSADTAPPESAASSTSHFRLFIDENSSSLPPPK